MQTAQNNGVLKKKIFLAQNVLFCRLFFGKQIIINIKMFQNVECKIMYNYNM